jgi:hypothetical protein
MRELLQSNRSNFLADRAGEEVPESPRARVEYQLELQKDEVVEMMRGLDQMGQQQAIVFIRRSYPNAILDD